MILFGPGVSDVAIENINIDKSSVNVKVSIICPLSIDYILGNIIVNFAP